MAKKPIDKDYLLTQFRNFNKEIVPKVKLLKINAAYTEADFLEYIKQYNGYNCFGFFYNADENTYCSFESLYSDYKIGNDTVHFGYCKIRGLHNSIYNVDYYIDDEDGSTWYKIEPQDYINLDSYATKEELKELAMLKVPNAIINGNPTINNGQISDFSSSDYLTLPFEFNPAGRAFEINMCFTTDNDVSSAQNIYGSKYCIAAYIQNSKIYFKVSSDGNTWDALDYETSFLVLPNTTYYVKLLFDRLNYKIFYSMDGKEYTQDGYVTTTLEPHPGNVYIGIGNNQHNPFLGIINFNKWEIKFNNNYFWEGMDDVGLSTRLAVDLENIDAVGIERIKEIAGDISVKAENVTYDNNKSGLLSDNVQDAIDELSQSGNAGIEISYEDWKALPDKESDDNLYLITDLDGDINASTIMYDENTNLKQKLDAMDEEISSKGDGTREMTKAEFNALADKSGRIIVTDENTTNDYIDDSVVSSSKGWSSEKIDGLIKVKRFRSSDYSTDGIVGKLCCSENINVSLEGYTPISANLYDVASTVNEIGIVFLRPNTNQAFLRVYQANTAKNNGLSAEFSVTYVKNAFINFV